MRDPKAYVRQFPDSLAAWDTFDDTMAWLDAVCYAATDPREVAGICKAHPELKLRCLRYDGSDAVLSELRGLLEASKRGAPMLPLLARDCLLEILKQICKVDVRFADAQINFAPQESPYVATLELGIDRRVRVGLLHDISPTDLVPQGVLAHHRMVDGHNGYDQCLLVIAGTPVASAMLMTLRVTITALDAAQIRSALTQMALR